MYIMIHIFTDSSCSKINGVGCFCILNSLDDVADIRTVVFNCHKSTCVEFMTVLAAFDYLKRMELIVVGKINIYTDCDGFVKYSETKKNNSIDIDACDKLKGYFDVYDIDVHKIKGHNKKDNIVTREQKIFRIIDRCARKELRKLNRCIG